MSHDKPHREGDRAAVGPAGLMSPACALLGRMLFSAPPDQHEGSKMRRREFIAALVGAAGGGDESVRN
jgi:hypothetical protein